MQYNKDNFFNGTYAEFEWSGGFQTVEEIFAKFGRPDFISNSGTMYWYWDDGVTRIPTDTEHWNKVGSCIWRQDFYMDDFSSDYNFIAGFCEWGNFKPLRKTSI